MKLIDIVYYSRCYRDEHNRIHHHWYYNKSDDPFFFVNDSKEILDELSHNGDVCPVFAVDMITAEKEFLRSIEKAKLIEDLSCRGSKDFDREFKIYIDDNDLFSVWHNYEQSILRIAAESWCLINNIEYEE